MNGRIDTWIQQLFLHTFLLPSLYVVDQRQSKLCLIVTCLPPPHPSALLSSLPSPFYLVPPAGILPCSEWMSLPNSETPHPFTWPSTRSPACSPTLAAPLSHTRYPSLSLTHPPPVHLQHPPCAHSPSLPLVLLLCVAEPPALCLTARP